jgi:hypothetical protein
VWTPDRIEKALADCGVTITKRGPAEYLARLINEEAAADCEALGRLKPFMRPTGAIPFRQDNVVIWKTGWPL